MPWLGPRPSINKQQPLPLLATTGLAQRPHIMLPQATHSSPAQFSWPFLLLSGLRTPTSTCWGDLDARFGPSGTASESTQPFLQMASVSIQDIYRWVGGWGWEVRTWSVPHLLTLQWAVLKPLWRMRDLGSLMTKVSSDLGITLAPDQEGKPVPSYFSAIRRVGA